MVIRCFFVSSYMYVTLFCVCMVYVSTLISFSRLHLFVKMYASGMVNGKAIYVVFLFCSDAKFAFIMFL